MEIDSSVLQAMVARAVQRVQKEMGETAYESAFDTNYGVFSQMEEAIAAAEKAQREVLKQTPNQRQCWVDIIRKTCLQQEIMERMSRLAVCETGIGRYTDKVIKNTAAAKFTPGTEDLRTEASTGAYGLTLFEYCPFGVIGAITPTTNPTETIINNSICMIAGGNAVVFSPHPRAKKTSIYLIQTLNKALAEAGAPNNMITMVANPSLEATDIMIHHPKVRMLVATGGPAIVQKVLSSGKKAIGAGPGNPPVVVDETANIEQAAKDIVAGSSFDNNVPCIAEKEVFAVDSIFDYLLINMKRAGAYEIKNDNCIEKLWQLVSKEDGSGPKVEFVGKSAAYILKQIGIEVDDTTRLIIMETDKEHPFVQEEMMMPILPLVRCENVDQAIAWAYEAEHGNRHSAMMHSTNIAKLSKMAKLMETTIFVKNGPSYAGLGIGGQGYPTFTIAGPTGEGLTSPRSFCRRRECVLKDMFNIR